MKKLILFFIYLLLIIPCGARTIYVDANATGTNDGSSPENAYSDIQDALEFATAQDQLVTIQDGLGISQTNFFVKTWSANQKVSLVETSGEIGKMLYWTSIYQGAIKRTNLYNPTEEYVTSASVSTGIALDIEGERIYWTGKQGVYRANLDGTNSERLVAGAEPSHICGYYSITLDVEAGKMYWVQGGTQADLNKIWCANLDGSDVEVLLCTELFSRPCSVAIDSESGKLYWTETKYGTNKGSVRRANLDGSNIENLAQTISGGAYGLGLDLSEKKMYWTDNGSGQIWRANLDGTMAEILVRNQANPLGLTLDLEEGIIYWAELYDRLIKCCRLDGSDVKSVIIADGGPEGIALYTLPKDIKAVNLTVQGPAEVVENFSAQFVAVADFDDGSTRDVTDIADWSVSPGTYASIDSRGLLSTGDINVPVNITIKAGYPSGVPNMEDETTVQIVLAGILHVTNEYPTIQAAIDASKDGDVVLIADGIYTGPGNRDIDFRGKAVKLESENGSQNCIIDCKGTGAELHRGFCFHSGENLLSVVDGLTIINGYAPMEKIYNWQKSVGGAIFCDSSSPTIQNCLIKNNFAEMGIANVNHGGGGGIYCYHGSEPLIKNCIITENYGDPYGGGIMCNFGSSPRIENCTISRNTASYGVPVMCKSGTPSIIGCLITDNLSTDGSSAVVGCRGPIIDCIIMNNRSKIYGAGGLSGCAGPISNCIIAGNYTPKDGGGLYNCLGTISNCLIADNYAGGNGGGIYLYNSHESMGDGPVVTGCTIVGNIASNGNALGLSCGNTPLPHSVEFKSCILWNGNDQIWNNNLSKVTIIHSNIQGSWPGNGNIDTDPHFVDSMNSNYRLLSESLCINAGDPNYVPEPNETDLDGLPRVIGGRIDMGAFEFNHIPNADAGPNQVAYAWIDGLADVSLDGSGSYDDDNDVLDYYWSWTIDGNSYDANGVSPVIKLPVGEHIIELIVIDGIDDSEPDQVTITVIEPMESRLWIWPRVINRKSRQPRIMAWMRLPKGITKDQVDRDEPLILYPGEIESTRQFVIQSRGRFNRNTYVFAFFDKAELMDAISENGWVELQVVGQLEPGQYFYGTDTVRITAPRPRRRWPRFYRR